MKQKEYLAKWIDYYQASLGLGHNYIEIKWHILSAQKSSQFLHIELAFALYYDMGQQKTDSIFLISKYNEINSGIEICFPD